MTQTMRQRSALVRAAERGLRREQPLKCGRIALVAIALVAIYLGVTA